MIVFTVRGEPTAKGRPRFVRATGGAFTPQKTVNYEALIKDAAARVMGDREPFDGALRLTIRAVYLIPQSWSAKKKRDAIWKTSKPDWDNLGKLVSDACNKIVYRDDAQVAEVVVQKQYGPLSGLTVSVEPLSAIRGVE